MVSFCQFLHLLFSRAYDLFFERGEQTYLIRIVIDWKHPKIVFVLLPVIYCL